MLPLPLLHPQKVKSLLTLLPQKAKSQLTLPLLPLLLQKHRHRRLMHLRPNDPYLGKRNRKARLLSAVGLFAFNT